MKDEPKKKSLINNQPENKNLKDNEPKKNGANKDDFKDDCKDEQKTETLVEDDKRTNNFKHDENQIQFISTEIAENCDLSDVSSEVTSIADDDHTDPLQPDEQLDGHVPDIPSDT